MLSQQWLSQFFKIGCVAGIIILIISFFKSLYCGRRKICLLPVALPQFNPEQKFSIYLACICIVCPIVFAQLSAGYSLYLVTLAAAAGDAGNTSRTAAATARRPGCSHFKDQSQQPHHNWTIYSLLLATTLHLPAMAALWILNISHTATTELTRDVAEVESLLYRGKLTQRLVQHDWRHATWATGPAFITCRLYNTFFWWWLL